MQNKSIAAFKRNVIAFHTREGRHTLPWRHTRDPYLILVSEIMLQQTQVDRVIPFFVRWSKRFPTAQTLASASLADVLREWQGLGYNRRGKLLRECAKKLVEKHGGKVPRDRALLLGLPGIGPYTAGAIRAFAFDEPEVFIETNIRTALIHHFFPRPQKIPDTKLIPILSEILPSITSPRTWYAALMDYGSFLKKTRPNPSRRSAHHHPQKRFEGSLRQARGAVIRLLTAKPCTERALRESTLAAEHIAAALTSLEKEGMIVKNRKTWSLAL